MSSEFIARVDDWLAWLLHNAGRSPATCSKYRGHLQRFGTWYTHPPAAQHLAPVGEDPLRPSLADLERFSGPFAHSLNLKPRARRPLVSAIRGFFTWYASTTRGTNPAAALPQPKAGRRLPIVASLEDAERLLMAPDVQTFAGLRDAAMLAMLLGGAFRVSGLLAMNESALTWYRDEDGRERLVVKVREKGDAERLVPVANEAAMLLRAYLGHPDLEAIPRTLEDGDLVLFVSVNNRTIPDCDYHGEARRLTRRGLNGIIQAHAARVGVSPKVAHPHALRHLYGAEMIESDVDLRTTQSLLGHEDPKSTTIYTRLAHRKLRRAVDQANPLAKMRAPILDSLRQLHRATSTPPHVRSRPGAAQKPKSGGLPDG